MVQDYEKIGLMVGLEIHQQVAGKKLFCDCPAEIVDKEPDALVERYLRATAGESGKVDIAAAAETSKQRTFCYHVHHSHSCLVEVDEEPPHPMNNDALQTTLVMAKLLKSTIVDEVQVMRKIVVDGSNTTGFQRTSLVGVGGSLDVNGKKIGIQTICLEEDACKIVSRSEGKIVYNLSRLGIPLVEIATDPDIRSPDEAREVAAKLGMFLRSTGYVKRGLGTIRQDVNVSITGGARVEIKGAQDLRMMPVLVENEILRQQNLIVLKKKLKGFKILKCNPLDVVSVFKNTKCTFLKKALQEGKSVFGMKVDGFHGLFGFELMPNHRVGTEVSDKTKVLTGAGIIHSDELPRFGVTQTEVDIVRKKLKCSVDDAFVLSAFDGDRIQRVFDVITDCVNHMGDGVISQVRMAKQDGTTKYLRPMPGAARMYPETDIPQIVPDVSSIVLPELIGAKVNRYVKQFGLSKDLASKVAKSGSFILFEELVGKCKKVKAGFIAEMLVSYGPDLLRNYKSKNPDVSLITDDVLKAVFVALHKGEISKDHVLSALLDVSLGKVFDHSSYEQASSADVEKVVKDVLKKNPGAPMGLLMGRCMAALQGKADGKVVSELLKKLM